MTKAEEAAKVAKTRALVDRVFAATSKYMDLETSDGVRREGRITGWRTREVFINGESVLWPIEMELNDDPNDRIPWDRVKRINIQGG